MVLWGARHTFYRAALTAFNPGESFIVLRRLRCRSGVYSKQKATPLLAAALCSSLVWGEEAIANFKDTDLKSFIETSALTLIKPSLRGAGRSGGVSFP